MATAEELINGARDRMAKSVEHAKSGFATVRTELKCSCVASTDLSIRWVASLKKSSITGPLLRGSR